MQKILVPTDFSGQAHKALVYAAEIATRSEAEIYLLHVLEPRINMATMQSDSLSQTRIKRATDKLQESVRSALETFPDAKIVPYLLGNSVVNTIVEYAEAEDFDLIILATEGAAGLKRFFLGTTATKVIERADVPTLVIPADFEYRDPKKLLLATDRQERHPQLFNEIMFLAKAFSAEVRVLSVKDKEESRTKQQMEKDLEEFRVFLEGQFPEATIRTELLQEDSFVDTIDDYCEKNEIDLLTMVAYPKSAFERFIDSSHTKTMAFQTNVPILALPAKATLKD